ncbi:hypothetical protein PMIN02_005034 [Paraphaeosphaeria minitans]
MADPADGVIINPGTTLQPGDSLVVTSGTNVRVESTSIAVVLGTTLSYGDASTTVDGTPISVESSDLVFVGPHDIDSTGFCPRETQEAVN